MSGPQLYKRNAGLAAGALLASSATLVCCVLPAVLVTLGAGAALAGLVTAVPQLIWLSEHKPMVFTLAGILLAISGASLWWGRRAPCPADPGLALSCRRLRRVSAILYAIALASFVLGATFAFLLPALRLSGEGDVQISDLHVWRVGPEAHAAILSVIGGSRVNADMIRSSLARCTN